MNKRQNFNLEHKPKGSHTARNISLGILALLILVFFFAAQNDFRFDPASRLKASTGKRAVIYTGPLKRKNINIPDKSLNRIDTLFKRNKKHIEKIEIFAERQDSYAKLEGATELRIKVTVYMLSGAKLKSPMQRVRHDKFVSTVLSRITSLVNSYQKDRYEIQDKKIDTYTNS